MLDDEKIAGQAAVADAGTDAEKVEPGQAGQPGTDGSGEGAGVVQQQYYTPEELAATPLIEIDLEKVDPAQRPVWEKKVGEHKELQGEFTRRTQRLQELEKQGQAGEKHFDDPKTDADFKRYLKDPINTILEVTTKIRQLRAVDSESDSYENAQAWIAYYEDIEKIFPIKRDQIINAQRDADIAETKLRAELGADAPKLEEFAKSLGFSSKDFRNKPELRASIKKLYDEQGKGRIVRPQPPKLGGGSVLTGASAGKKDVGKMTAQEIYEAKQRGENPYE